MFQWLVEKSLASRLFVLAAAVASGMYVRARRQLIATLRDRARRAEAEQSDVVAALSRAEPRA